MRSGHYCVDLHYHPVLSFVFTLRYFASSDGDSFRTILFILVFSSILWRNSHNPMRDDDCINITYYILIIHIIFQRSLTRGTKTGIKTETQSFLVTIVYTFNWKMWFAIVIACLSFFEYGSTCNVDHGKYFFTRN